MSEKSIVNQIVRKVEDMGAYVIKTTGVAAAGTPDLIICYKGRFFGIEVKTPTGRVTKRQSYQLERIRESGGIGVVVRDAESAVNALLITYLLDSDSTR